MTASDKLGLKPKPVAVNPTKRLLQPQLHFVCGKGGVGKSMFACALARLFAQTRLRTLLVQIAAQDSHSALLQCIPVTNTVDVTLAHLWTVNLCPQLALEEYVSLKVHSRILCKLLLRNSLVHAFTRFSPALAELTMLGKLCHHARQTQADGTRQFDRIVVDCPATGHGALLLQTPRVAHKTLRPAPIANDAKQVADLLADPARSVLHIVTLASELPVSESVELHKRIRDGGSVPLGMVVVNALAPVLFSANLRNAMNQLEQTQAQPQDNARHDSETLARIHALGRTHMLREQEQQAWLQAARQRIPLPLLELPLLPQQPPGLGEVDYLAKTINQMLTSNSPAPSPPE